MAVSFMILTENQEDTDHWNAIVGNGGEESRVLAGARIAGGFSWQIAAASVAARRDERPGSASSREAAMEAMMTWKKIDIATIEAARRGEGR